jgi:hypothetical protein
MDALMHRLGDVARSERQREKIENSKKKIGN